MVNVSYKRDIPDAANNPSNDQPDMRINTNSLDTLINQDHVGFGNTHGGKHKVIHIPEAQTAGTSPGTGATEWNYYTKRLSPGGPVETFWQRPAIAANGADIQMTANVVPLPAQSGRTFLPGGMFMQWGRATINTNGSVSFSPAFPSNAYTVYVTVLENNDNRHFVHVKTIGSASFTVASRDSSGADETNTFSWMAIGPSV